MKTKFYILILMAAATLVSCEKMLEQQPYGQFTSEQINKESIEGLVASAYSGLSSHLVGNNEAFSGPLTNWVFDVRSDDALKGGDAVSMEANIHQLETSVITSDNATCQFKWMNDYWGIIRVHQAMNQVISLQPDNMDIIVAEMKTLRAFFYFDLIKVFERIPYYTETEDPTNKSAYEYTRDQIFSFIEQDLIDAIAALPEAPLQPGRFNKYAAAAIMTKVAAFRSNWDNVITYADMIISSGRYELYPYFQDMSRIANNNQYESIVAVQHSTANNNIQINWSNLLNTTYSDGNVYGTGDDFFLASQNLVDAFRTDANGLPYLDNAPSTHVTSTYNANLDVRLDLTVGRVGFLFRGNEYTDGWCRNKALYGEYSGKKWMVAPGECVSGFPWGASGLNFIFIRYADILLLKAEALIEKNSDLATAMDLINQVRKKAARSISESYVPQDIDLSRANYMVGLYEDGTNCTWTQDYARKAVRMERRLELAMEGHRWFDLVRWSNDDPTYITTTMNNYYQYEVEFEDYYNGAEMNASELFLPIPKSETDKAPDLYTQG